MLNPQCKKIKLSSISRCLIGLVAAGVSAAYAQGGPDVVLDRAKLPDFVPDEVVVKLKAPEGALSRAMISPMGLDTAPRQTSGGELVYKLTRAEMMRLETGPADVASQRVMDIAKQLSQNPDVEYAQPNWLYQPLQTPNDPLYPKQWHYFNNGSGAGESPGGINLPKAWTVTKGSRSVVVAVIDTGQVMNHPDLDTNNVVPGFDFIDDLKRSNDGDGRDGDANDPGDAMKTGECGKDLFGQPQPPQDYPSSWHGSHVAGTIGVGGTNNGTGIAGINWEVKVQPLRVLGKCGGSTSEISDAIRWAAGLDVPNVPKNTTPAKVINMSLGGNRACKGGFFGGDQMSQSAINDAVAAGVTVVVAAGNDGKDAAGYSPAGCDNVITVAAGDPHGVITNYSNFGASVEILAPGGQTERCAKPEGGVLSMVARGAVGGCPVPDAYAFYNGTSMASPHVAGVAALMLAAKSSLTPDQILQMLQSTAMPRSAAQCPPSKPCGAGLLDANAAVLAAQAGGTGPAPTLTVSLPTATLELQVGQAASTQATVTKAATPVAGTTVNFSSSASNIASVSPASGVTDTSGQAQATVEGLAEGDAVITAQADGAKATQAVRVPARVPALSHFGLILLVAAVVLVSLLGRGAKAARK